MRYATVKLDLSTATATVVPDDGGRRESYRAAGLARAGVPAVLAQSGWRMIPNVRWSEYSDGYQCRVVQR